MINQNYMSTHKLFLPDLPSKNSFSLSPFSVHTILCVFEFLYLFLCSLFLYLHCFPDMSQPTPPFLLFLFAFCLPLLSSLIILPHLLLEPGSIKEGENPALVFCSTLAVSLFFVLCALVNCSILLLTLFSMLLCKSLIRQRNANMLLID